MRSFVSLALEVKIAPILQALHQIVQQGHTVPQETMTVRTALPVCSVARGRPHVPRVKLVRTAPALSVTLETVSWERTVDKVTPPVLTARQVHTAQQEQPNVLIVLLDTTAQVPLVRQPLVIRAHTAQ